MSTTTRLDYDDPGLLEFRARVVASTDEGSGRSSVILDRTAFYPESGGQMSDRGELGGRSIVDVQIGDDESLRHWIEGAPLAVGEEVLGRIDRARRRVHMALHTGQHILSKALLDTARAETVSARLGETACTIDVGVASIDERDIARAEDLANAVIDDDVAIRWFFPTEAELASLSLRRTPKVSENIRIVQIGEFDVTPCGGTHCRNSAEVGLIHIDRVDRYKGGTRVTFSAGRRARDTLGQSFARLAALAGDLSCGTHDVANAIDRLRRDLGAAREALGHARARLAASGADELVARAQASGSRFVVALLDADVELLRVVAKRITEAPEWVAMLAAVDGDSLAVIVTRGSTSPFDCGAFLKRAAVAGKGRGGGRPERAEGRMPSDVDWPNLCQRLLAASAG